MLRERFLSQKSSKDVIENWEIRSTHVITAQIRVEDKREAKEIFRSLLSNEFELDLGPSDKIYAEDDGYGTFQCIVVIKTGERG